MKGRTFITGSLSGAAALALFGWAPVDGVVEANGSVTPSLDPARISAVLVPTRPGARTLAAPQGGSNVKQTSREPDGNSSLPVPLVAPGVDGLGASDIYFNKKWIGVDLASHHGRDSTSTRGGS